MVEQRDARIKSLETLLERAKVDTYSEREIATLEKKLAESIAEVMDLKNQVKTGDKLRNDLEKALQMERERVDRYALKVGELKKRFETTPRQTKSTDVVQSPQEEAAVLRKEVHRIKQSNLELVNIIREALCSIYKDVSIETRDPKSMKVRLDFAK